MQHKVDAMANSVCAIVLCLRINLLLVLHVWMYGCMDVSVSVPGACVLLMCV